MNRTALLLTLLAAYIAVAVQLAGMSDDRRLDALAPQSRSVEQAIGERRFVDALPLALEVQRAHDDDPLVAFWLATIFRGLDRPRDEAAAWETYIRLSSAPAEACPGVAEAYERLGERARSLDHLIRCVSNEPREPDHLVDLGDAWELEQKDERALAAYRAAALLGAHDPMLADRIERLSRRMAGGQ